MHSSSQKTEFIKNGLSWKYSATANCTQRLGREPWSVFREIRNLGGEITLDDLNTITDLRCLLLSVTVIKWKHAHERWVPLSSGFLVWWIWKMLLIHCLFLNLSSEITPAQDLHKSVCLPSLAEFELNKQVTWICCVMPTKRSPPLTTRGQHLLWCGLGVI